MTLAKGKVSVFLGRLAAIVFFLQGFNAVAQSVASTIFNDREALVYQIRVIDIASGDKYSIGSGFQVSTSGYLATNFHVVSSYAHEPEKYRLEYVRADNVVGELSLLAVDVIHDLAIVETHSQGEERFEFARSRLDKGARIYSMGNPHDLGMTIVEGTYNGLVENSRFRKILFSGSLNPGMSGGPALNAAGEVIGVNVSTGGEQISFLVPVEHLAALLETVEESDADRDISAVIRSDLLADQDEFYRALLAGDWHEKTMGELLVPRQLHDSLKCWGHTTDEDDVKFQAVHQHCRGEDEIYLDNYFFVGDFNYDVQLLTTDELNRFQFYNLLEQKFTHHRHSSSHDDHEVTGYACNDDLVGLFSGTWKISTCFRAYRNYPGLYDGSMIMASTDYPRQAAIVRVSATGISAENARGVFRRVMEAVSWKH